MAVCRLQLLKASKTGSDVTSPVNKSNKVSYQRSILGYSCNMQHLKVVLNFLIVDYGGMPISTARGRGSDVTCR
jgi:hypothetical protein